MSEDYEYQKWLKIFYEGNLLIPGWNLRKRELLSVVKNKKEDAEILLTELGDLIGKEWAKDNMIRKISTSDVKRWGDELKRVKGSSDDNVLRKLYDIKQEVMGRLK